MSRTPRRVILLAALVAATSLLVACGDGDEGDASQVAADPAAGAAGADGTEASAPWSAQDIRASHERAGFFPQVANAHPGIGPVRLQVALMTPGQEMIHDAQVNARLYYLGDAQDSEAVEAVEFVAEHAFTARSINLDEGQVSGAGGASQLVSTHLVHHPGHVTVYVAPVEFDRAGWWGAELDVTVEGETHEDVRLRFWVQESTPEPRVGDPVPATRQPTIHDVDDIADLDTTRPPNPELHDVTVAEALERGEPFVVAFVTPAFCQTRFCGPVMEAVVLPAWREYGDRVRFIHIEPFDVPKARAEGVLEPVEATLEWNLRVEPMIFVVGRDGRVAGTFEGILELEELEEALEAVLAE